jgi:hypothetical protein
MMLIDDTENIVEHTDVFGLDSLTESFHILEETGDTLKAWGTLMIVTKRDNSTGQFAMTSVFVPRPAKDLDNGTAAVG